MVEEFWCQFCPRRQAKVSLLWNIISTDNRNNDDDDDTNSNVIVEDITPMEGARLRL